MKFTVYKNEGGVFLETEEKGCLKRWALKKDTYRCAVWSDGEFYFVGETEPLSGTVTSRTAPGCPGGMDDLVMLIKDEVRRELELQQASYP